MEFIPADHPALQEQEGTFTEQIRREDLELSALMYRNTSIKFAFENKEAILKLHSSSKYTTIFQMDCSCCKLFYKHCMFSNKERKSDYPMCRWYQAESHVGLDAFEIDLHVHCNRGGKKSCGRSRSLEEPKAVVVVDKPMMDTLPQPEVVLKKKMGQEERKALMKAGATDIWTG